MVQALLASVKLGLTGKMLSATRQDCCQTLEALLVSVLLLNTDHHLRLLTLQTYSGCERSPQSLATVFVTLCRRHYRKSQNKSVQSAKRRLCSNTLSVSRLSGIDPSQAINVILLSNQCDLLVKSTSRCCQASVLSCWHELQACIIT